MHHSFTWFSSYIFFFPKKSRDIFILSETVLNSEMLKKERHSLVPDTEWERHPLTPKDCNFVPIYNIFRSVPPSSPKTTEILSMETYLNLTLFKTLKFYKFRISIIAISFSYCNSDIDFVPALLPAMGWGVLKRWWEEIWEFSSVRSSAIALNVVMIYFHFRHELITVLRLELVQQIDENSSWEFGSTKIIVFFLCVLGGGGIMNRLQMEHLCFDIGIIFQYQNACHLVNHFVVLYLVFRISW